jgi:dienelactone hydrolase
VVVALHGCNGLVDMRVAAKRGHDRRVIDPAGALQSRYREYAHWLAERGYAVLMPDSYSVRGGRRAPAATPSNRARSTTGRAAATRWPQCAG